MDLLTQTDNYLKELGAKVKIQKGEIIDIEDDQDIIIINNEIEEKSDESSELPFRDSHFNRFVLIGERIGWLYQ